MPRDKDEDYIQPYWDDVLEELPDDETFFIGKSYEKEAATTLGCKVCGNSNFKVGRGDFYTAIKCINCDWQLCIHEG